jgi:hypothetical protein
MSQEFEQPILGPALKVLNQLVEERVMESYVMGGSTALVYFTEPMYTEDVDIFCVIPQSGFLLTIKPVTDRLQQLGYEWGKDEKEAQYIIVEGVLIQILLPPGELMEEGMKHAITIDVEGIPTRILDYE